MGKKENKALLGEGIARVRVFRPVAAVGQGKRGSGFRPGGVLTTGIWPAADDGYRRYDRWRLHGITGLRLAKAARPRLTQALGCKCI